MSRVLIIGYGNPLRSDDGFGWHAAEIIASQFRDCPDIHVMSCQQLTPDLSDDLSCAELVVFIDASRTLPPGELKIEELLDQSSGDAPYTSAFTHHTSPSGLLHLCQDLWGRAPRAFLFTVGAFEYDQGEKLSGPVHRALDSVVSRIATMV